MGYNLISNIATCLAFKEAAPMALVRYSHIPTAIVALIIGLYVYFKSKKSPQGSSLLAISIFFALWNSCNLILWEFGYNSQVAMFFWSLLGPLTMLLMLSCLLFTYQFVDKKNMSFKKRVLAALLGLPIIILMPTSLNLVNFDAVNCNATEGAYYTNYYYGFELFIFLWILILLIRRFVGARKEDRKKIIIFSVGLQFFIISFFITGYISSLLDDFNFEMYGLFGMVFFMVVLSFLIVKYKVFNIKLIGTQALVSALIILIGSEFFFIQNFTNKILTSITLALALVFGGVLIQSVKKEVRARNEIEEINKDLDLNRNELEKANSRLKKLDKTKSEFLSIASHQLRTPISGIKGYLSMILEGDFGKIEEKPKEILQSIYDNTERLNGLVNDFLDVSRIERGKLVMERQPTDISEMIQSIVTNFQPVAEAKGLKLDYTPPKSEIPKVDIDPNKLRQVALNLVDNAIKYTHAGSVHVMLDGQKDHFKVCVKDTGVGLDPDEAKNLFRPFVRTADSSKSNATGSGLGLYVARKIVQYHGGKVWAESEGKGKGSTFCMEVPYDQSTLPEPEPEPYLE